MQKGLKEPSLRQVRCTSDEFSLLFSYRFYRLPNQDTESTKAENSYAKKETQYLSKALVTLMFIVTDSLRIFDFIYQYTIQCRDLYLCENEANMSLRSFHLPPKLESFNTTKENRIDIDGVYNWHSSVNF